MRRKTSSTIIAVICFLAFVSVAGAAFLRSQFLAENVAEQVSTVATESLGNQVKIGQVAVESAGAVGVKDITVYDNFGGVIATVDYANVEFSILSMIAPNPLDGVSQINVSGVKANIVQRDDGKFNFEDLISGEPSENNYYGKFHVQDAEALLSYEGKELVLEDLVADLDFANYPSIRIIGSGVNQGAAVDISGNVGGDRTTVTVEAENILLENYTQYIPDGTIPPDISDIKGRIDHVQATYVGIGQDKYFTGEIELSDGEAVILDKKVEKIRGFFVLNEKNALVFANATCAGQQAAVHGKVFIDTSVPVLDMIVEAHDFDPGKIMQEIDYSGGINAVAHVTGPANNPAVDAEVNVPAGFVEGYSFHNMSAKVHYADSKVFADDLSLDIFNGQVKGQAEFNSADMSYVAHVKVADIDVSYLQDKIPSLRGFVTGDLAFEGISDDVANMKVYGSVEARYLSYGMLGSNVADMIHSSFAKQADRIDIDFLSAQMSGGGILGLEGNIVLGETIDMAVYADNVNIGQFNQINPALGLGGRLSLDATVKGPLDNPVVRADVSAHDGQVLFQKFDKLQGSIAGSLRGFRIKDFVMEHGDDTKWYINGQMGNKKPIEENSAGMFGNFNPEDIGMNIRVDTVAARMEDLIKVVDPEIPITGNVDNVITVTGTLANPEIVGFINYYIGSYAGTFIKTIAGDYRLHNGVVTLQDMNIAAPWFDADLNGTISDIEGDQKLDIQIETHDIDMERFSDSLQYPLAGHAKFSGSLTGSAAHPVFDGEFDAEEMILNGQQLYDAGGHISYKDKIVSMDRVGFDDVDDIGYDQYNLTGTLNLDNMIADCVLAVKNADAGALLKIMQAENDKIKGNINGRMTVSGDIQNIIDTEFTEEKPVMYHLRNGLLDNVRLRTKFTIDDGSVAGYAISDANLELSMANSVIRLHSLHGVEGEKGTFDMSGTVDLRKDIQAKLDITDVHLDMLTKSANVPGDMTGTVNGSGTISGDWDNPVAELVLDLDEPGTTGVTLDNVVTLLHLSDGVINIDKFRASKNIAFGDDIREYYGTAEGTIPLAALSSDEAESNGKSMNVLISLEDAELSVLPGLSPHIEWAVGELDGKVRITGNRLNPAMDGSISIQGISVPGGAASDGAAIKIKELAEPIENISSLVTFAGNIITIDHFNGNLGGGSYNAKGYAIVDGTGLKDYSFDLIADKLGIHCDFFNGPVDAELHVAKTTSERLWQLMQEEQAKKAAAGEADPAEDDMDTDEADSAEGSNEDNASTEGSNASEGDKNVEEESEDENSDEESVGENIEASKAEEGENPEEANAETKEEKPKKAPPRRPASRRDFSDMPLISGRVFIQDAIISIPSLESSDDPLPNFFFNFHLDLGENVRFYVPQMANLDLGGNVHVFGSTKYQHSSGSIYCKKGTVSYLKTSFKLREAALQFNQWNSIIPSVKLFADTKISRTRVFLTMNGPLYGNTKLRLSSDPPMNEADIIKFLTLRSSYKPGANNDDLAAASSMATMALQMALLGEIEESMRNSMGLDLFTVERDTVGGSNEIRSSNEQEIYNVVIGKNLSEKTMLKGSKSVNSEDYRITYEYNFDDKFGINISQDKRKGVIFGAEALFTF